MTGSVTGAQSTGRKRKSLVNIQVVSSYLEVYFYRPARLSTEHAGRGTDAPPEFDTQSSGLRAGRPGHSVDTGSHHHRRAPLSWLPPRDLIAYSFHEPREIFMVPVPMPLARCLFCRLLPFSCSLLASIILPLGRTNLFSSRILIECPRRSGKQSRQHWIGTSPQHSSLTGLRTTYMARTQ